jgi:hypothetical protein
VIGKSLEETVGKQTSNRKGFSCKTLNDVESKEQYRVKISNRFAALEDLGRNVDISRARETVQENIKISAKDSVGYYEFKWQKTWFDDECSKLVLDQGNKLN